ncbi:hypothetical protein BJ742DRAFT_737888 [Cladochytrium replicatum]|nr:hypothetical protein BJ742DRAFT_737888 [Cladochytrium replicatum]
MNTHTPLPPHRLKHFSRILHGRCPNLQGETMYLRHYARGGGCLRSLERVVEDERKGVEVVVAGLDVESDNGYMQIPECGSHTGFLCATRAKRLTTFRSQTTGLKWADTISDRTGGFFQWWHSGLEMRAVHGSRSIPRAENRHIAGLLLQGARLVLLCPETAMDLACVREIQPLDWWQNSVLRVLWTERAMGKGSEEGAIWALEW